MSPDKDQVREALEALVRLSFDMHTESKRPCTTCEVITERFGFAFGCVAYRQRLGARPSPGEGYEAAVSAALSTAMRGPVVDGELAEPDYEAAAKVWFYEVGRRSGVDMKFETAYDSEQADFIEVATRAVDAALNRVSESSETTRNDNEVIVDAALGRESGTNA